MKKPEALEQITTLIIKFLSVGPDRARYLADRIYTEVVEPSIEEERDAFIRLAKFPDNLN